MKKALITLLFCLLAKYGFSDVIFQDSFEYGNTVGATPVGWVCNDQGWVSGHMEQGPSCKPRTGDWYAHTQAPDTWIFTSVTFITFIHYQLSLWTISDGAFQMEILFGDAPSPESMDLEIMPLCDINYSAYQEVMAETEVPATRAGYIGIHVVSCGGETLCIDDILLEQTFQYSFEVKPITTDTLTLDFGETAQFQFTVINTGYDTETLTLRGAQDMFTDTHFFIDEEEVSRFDILPREKKLVEMTTTFIDQELPYPIAWIDVIVASTHNCNTGMVTFYVYPKDPNQIGEHVAAFAIYPNPTSDFVNIDLAGAQSITLLDQNGQIVMESEESPIDLRQFPSGIYFMALRAGGQVIVHRIVKQ